LSTISVDIKKKVERYCAYQERCQEDVRRKLSELGVRGAAAETLIAELISGRFINEERFARTFARGKFRINHWGRRKIEAALKAKKISAPCIRSGMQEIQDHEYKRLLMSLASKPPVNNRMDAIKRFRQLAAKGFEPVLIREYLQTEDDFPDNLP
jgi:regulatory protein